MNNYPLIEIPIDRVFYMVEHPEFRGSSKSNAKFLDRHKMFEAQLKTQGFVTRSIDSIGNEGEMLSKNINLCWRQFSKYRGMMNPLIVKKHENKYYVIIGNQRLTVLKAKNFRGYIPCRIADPDDYWDKRCKPMKAHPYRILEDV